MSEDDRLDREERKWLEGNRAAWVKMLAKCVSELGYDDPRAASSRWLLEREGAVAALRRVCEEYGDNEWDENLNLADVVEKHLERHLDPDAEET